MAKLPALPFVRSGVTEGLSANQAYRDYQAAAREIDFQASRRQDFLRLYSQTRALRGIAGEAVRAPKDQIPEARLIINRDTQLARGHGTWVAIFQRTKGESDFLSMPYLIKSAQPLTPQEAENQALAFLNTRPDEYDRITLGVTYVGTERFVPR